MDPWYCFDIEFNYNENIDFAPWEIHTISPDGNWIVDYLDNDECNIVYNHKSYKKVMFENNSKKLFLYENENDYDVYVLQLVKKF